MKIKVGILGATGYTGVVLIKLLLKHPNVEIVYLSSEQHVGKKISDIYPGFYGVFDAELKVNDEKQVSFSCDMVFLATPNGFAKEFVPKLFSQKKDLKVVDLSTDFRLEKELKLSDGIKINVCYGLAELHRDEIKKSAIIANPGCYPTSILLALAPAIKNKTIDLNSIIADSKSGVTGAGRQNKQELQFSEVNESFAPYNLAGKHRHIPEIENEIFKLSNEKIKVVFSPHLLPINRGILSTVYADVLTRKSINQQSLYDLYKNYYKNECFVKVLPENIYANTKNVRYTNFCSITPLLDERTNRLIIVSAIDNMVKGASGQAVQNMNIMYSFDEKLGLDSVAEIP